MSEIFLSEFTPDVVENRSYNLLLKRIQKQYNYNPEKCKWSIDITNYPVFIIDKINKQIAGLGWSVKNNKTHTYMIISHPKINNYF